MKGVIGLIFLILLLCSCTVPVDEPETIQNQENLKPPEHIQCFETFKTACQQGQWPLAYQCLSAEWQKAKTASQFQTNMEQVGIQHLDGARIVTLVKTENNGIETWAITTVNKYNDSTMFVLIKENNSWKIHGVRNLPKMPKN